MLTRPHARFLQLLEELMDSGMPMTTEPNILKELITPPSTLNRVRNAVMGRESINSVLPDGTTSNIPWRKRSVPTHCRGLLSCIAVHALFLLTHVHVRATLLRLHLGWLFGNSNVKYTNNEVYFDVIEEVDCIIDGNGSMVTCEVSGDIQCKCWLSGTPDLTLSFTDASIMDDCAFHPCVRYSRYERERVISFVPPDGAFKLLSFKVRNPRNQLPLYVKPLFALNKKDNCFRATITAGPKTTSKNLVEDVLVRIHCPKSTATCNLTATMGTFSFDGISKVFTWKIGKLPKEKVPQLTGDILMMDGAVAVSELAPCVTVQFSMQQHSVSGLNVDSVAVSNIKYKPYKGVKKCCKSGNVEVRVF